MCVEVEFPCQQEEVVAHAVEVRGKVTVYGGAILNETHYATLRLAAYRAADVSLTGCPCAAREYELVKGREETVDAVYLGFYG